MLKFLKSTKEKFSKTLDNADKAIDEAKNSVTTVANNANELLKNGDNKVEEMTKLLFLTLGLSILASGINIIVGIKTIKVLKSPDRYIIHIKKDI